MKLELKHLVPYLPHKLQMQDDKKEIRPLTGLRDTSIILDYDWEFDFQDGVKPLLNPMDLEAEIEHDGNTFVPLAVIIKANAKKNPDSNLSESFTREMLLSLSVARGNIPYWMAELLFKWHLDVFGLIGEGLAEAKK